MLVKFDCVYHVQRLSAITAGEKTETVSNKWEVKNRHWGPWSRSFCFPALHSCWGPDERKERKTTEVWEFVNAHKQVNPHTVPLDRCPSGWTDGHAPSNLLDLGSRW